jgi:hypothetical protein
LEKSWEGRESWKIGKSSFDTIASIILMKNWGRLKQHLLPSQKVVDEYQGKGIPKTVKEGSTVYDFEAIRVKVGDKGETAWP